MLLQYGFVKLFPAQFGTLRPTCLFETYGESSPMGLLWTFMAASVPYTMFGGLMEVVPGILLLFRRTAIVGALMAAAVILNVVMLNFCYDVPVKLYSLNLLFMAIFLAAPYLYSMTSLLVLRRVTRPPALYEPRFQKRRVQVAATVFKCLLVVAMVAMSCFGGWTGYRRFILNAPKPPLYGAWDLERSKFLLTNRGFHWISQYPFNRRHLSRHLVCEKHALGAHARYEPKAGERKKRVG